MSGNTEQMLYTTGLHPFGTVQISSEKTQISYSDVQGDNRQRRRKSRGREGVVRCIVCGVCFSFSSFFFSYSLECCVNISRMFELCLVQQDNFWLRIGDYCDPE